MATGEIDGFASDHERELYERAHEAAKEAQRQGDAQLQAAVAAAAVSTVYYPVATPVRFSSWSLKFQDRRLEAVYCRKCGSDSDFNDLGPAACELAFCILRLWWTIDAGQSKHGVVILSHVCVAAWCMAMLTSQLLFTKWYRQNRRLLLWQFAIVLWSWEGLQLYHTSNKLLDMALVLLPQCILISFLYRVPFCLHVRSRCFGCGCQLVASIASKASSSHLLGIIAGHCLGSLLAYMVDRQARTDFLESLPRWILGDAVQCERGDSSWWNSFYPEFLEKPEPAAKEGENPRDNLERALAYRALGGFAGGFGGVSGLKCANPSSLSPASSSNSVDHPQLVSYSSDNENVTAGLEQLPDSWSMGNVSQGPDEQTLQDGDQEDREEHSASSASSRLESSSLRRRF
ncbi:uncharacterized protein LOC112344807 isoform X1 [Selaginella moellendorffii]|uniref:uncharacterized protein LOC112344807 isoform X1 n=1 Tax=Selaginella moellendorffii TaxID=88036 RepID=UPI000D1CCC8F|nr:uncharacterized protein LOC112344807 isoform X1 [Selaginella moellendorffii]|eukprot:XP_024525942.1 uncharacterized protein LOC112344807 isoform X1 [Selaginella moellendorffii]